MSEKNIQAETALEKSVTDQNKVTKKMTRTQKITLGAVSALALMLVTAGSAFVFAQSSDSSETNFLDRVAQVAGVDATKLKDAFKQVSKETIDTKVADGKLTEEQAAKIKENIENEEFRGPGFGRGLRGEPGRFMGAGAEMQGISEFLGMSEDDLREAMRTDDKTLLEIAKEKGKTEDQLKSYLSTKFDERVSQALTDGKITETQANKMKENKDDMIERIMNREGRGPGRF